MRYLLPTIFLFFQCILAASAQSNVDSIPIHSLPEVIQKALQNNPTKAVYKQQVKKANYDYAAAAGYIYPHASASFDGTANLHLPVTPIPGKLFGRADSTIYVQFGKRYVYNTGITLSEDIFDWQSHFQKNIANQTVALNQLQQNSYEQTVKVQVAQSYFAALVAKASLSIAAADKLLADSIVAISKQRLAEGTTDGIAVNSAMINANNIAQNIAQSSQLYDESMANLKIVLGANANDALLLTETLRLDSLTDEQITSIGSDKSLAVYQQQVTIANLQSKAQRAIAYPRLSADMYIGAQQFRDNFGVGFNKGEWNGYRYIGIDFSMPLFTGLTNLNKYKSALTQKNIAQMQYDNAKEQSKINDSMLLKNDLHYREMVKSSAANFTLYAANVQLNKQKFEEGIISIDVYLKAFQDYLLAENNYLNNLSQLLNTKASILSRQ